MSQPIQINIRSVIQQKNPGLLKVLPGFVINYIRRILHEDDINKFLREFGHLHGLDFCDAIIREFGADVKVFQDGHVKDYGHYIYAANHPLGGLDGIAFMQAVGRYHPDLQFVVNDILLQVANLKELMVPVNKHGRNSAEMVKKINSLYQSDRPILIFPAGLVSRKLPGGIQDLEWKKSFVTKARQFNRGIVPVHIGGLNTNWFYGLSRFRKRVGIKANLEMFYLVDEMYRQRGKELTITFGKPVDAAELKDGTSDAHWAKKIREMVYDLNPKK